MSLTTTEIEIVRDEAGGKAYPWSVRKVTPEVYGPAPPPWATAADVEQAIRILRPQLALVPEGVELRVTIRPPEVRPRIRWRVVEKIYYPKRETVTFLEAASKREATEIVYAKVASESRTPCSLDRIYAVVHAKGVSYSIEKARPWDPFEAEAAA